MTEPTPEEIKKATEIFYRWKESSSIRHFDEIIPMISLALAEQREKHETQWSNQLKSSEAFREGFEEGKARAYEAMGENGLIPMKKHMAALENMRERCAKVVLKEEHINCGPGSREHVELIAEEIRKVPLEEQ